MARTVHAAVSEDDAAGYSTVENLAKDLEAVLTKRAGCK